MPPPRAWDSCIVPARSSGSRDRKSSRISWSGPSRPGPIGIGHPILVVEILSPTTRRRDREQKRELYVEAGVADTWMVDPEQRAITVVAAGRRDVVETEVLTWAPAGASASLEIEVAGLFSDS